MIVVRSGFSNFCATAAPRLVLLGKINFRKYIIYNNFYYILLYIIKVYGCRS